MKKIVGEVSDFSGGLNKTLADVQGFVAALDKDKVNSVIDNVTAFTDRLKNAGPDIDSVIADAKSTAASASEFAKNLTGRQDDFNKIISDAKELSARLNAASTRIDTILGNADQMLSTEGGKNFFGEATDAARSIRKAADTVTVKAGEVASGLVKFSGRGLDDVQTLVNELRALVARIDRAVAEISANPSSVVFGGNSSVREYNRH